MPGQVSRGIEYIRQHGLSYTLRRCGEKAADRLLHPYDRWWRRHAPTEAELAAQRSDQPEGAGLISVVIPVYNTRPDLLLALAESLKAQTLDRWEAILYDGRSTRPETAEALDRAAALDPRIRVIRGTENLGISGNTNRAIEAAAGTWIALCDHDDLLSPEALWQAARTIAAEDPDLIYSDEDKITEDGRWHTDPHMKPDFCPENLRAGNYICHLMVIRRSLLEAAGGLRPCCDGSQDHDLALRCTERGGKVCHIPKVLYHWRTVGASMSHQQRERCLQAGMLAVRGQCERMGLAAEVTEAHGLIHTAWALQGKPSVAAAVIDSGMPGDVERCLKKLRRLGVAETFVITPVQDPEAEERIIRWDPAESVWAAVNRAVDAMTGDYALVLHSGVQPQETDWLTAMLRYAQLPGVGAVTPLLTDRRGRILHAGFAGGRCVLAGTPAKAGGWHGWLWMTRNVSAVSGACFLIRRDRILPLDPRFRSGLGTLDWCRRLREAGLRQICTPDARGICTDAIVREWLLLLGKKREEADCRLLRPEDHDPCYSPVMDPVRADCSLAD